MEAWSKEEVGGGGANEREAVPLKPSPPQCRKHDFNHESADGESAVWSKGLSDRWAGVLSEFKVCKGESISGNPFQKPQTNL